MLLRVPCAIAARVRAMAEALLLHKGLNEASGHAYHFLGSAIGAAGELPPRARRAFRQVNQRANSAKHGWQEPCVVRAHLGPGDEAAGPCAGASGQVMDHKGGEVLASGDEDSSKEQVFEEDRFSVVLALPAA